VTDAAKGAESSGVEIRPFRIEVPQADLDDLQERLSRTRWANELPAETFRAETQAGPVPPGWEYGVPLDYLERLVAYWRDGYDWREWETRLNRHPQFTTTIDAQNIHFLHVRSPEPDALALILTHGWPNSFVEYLDLIGPLTDPGGHGGNPADAFHVVIPSIPGFAFSGPTREPGWNRYRTARAWVELMRRLGYDRYGTHGNDAGAYIAPEVARAAPAAVVGVHVNQIFSFPSGDPTELEGLTDRELGRLEFLQKFDQEMSAYAKLQATKPQNLAHALADSPAGQLAWIGQLLGEVVSPDVVVTNAAIYWLTNTGASSARFYYEDAHAEHPTEPTTAPTGLASFAFDFKPLRRLAERDHNNIVSWNDYDHGSHWAAHDAPDLLIDDIRQLFRQLR
jgi:epoxide hydrolase